MYNIKLEKYIPAPKPATSDRIVAAHYYAAWKKGAAVLHDAFNDLADEYPERTPLMGYYDEENPEVTDWEIKWALEHGINCFIHCWYRYQHNMGKPVTKADLRCAHGLHEALFNAKYGNMMKFAIMFECSERWSGTDEHDMLDNLMPFWMENYFKRENYLVIDNKPVLFVYSNRLETDSFPDKETQRRTFDACREYAKKCGFDGMLFAKQYSIGGVTKESYDDMMSRGYDFSFGYTSGFSIPNKATATEAEVVEGQLNAFKNRLALDPMRNISTASCAWAPEPRKRQHWRDLGFHYHDLWGGTWWLSPESFRKVIAGLRQMCDALPDGAWGKRMIMLDNWNEWDEGHFIAPNHKYGFGHLQAIREELTARDNLPDYRTPADQGFGGYNNSWRTPDFKDFCENLLEKI